jgi:small subunit ribosomal protein S1
MVGEAGTQEEAPAQPGSDISSLTSMLQAKWKGGKSGRTGREPARTGQIRSFRILKMDPASKKIELELA